MRQERRPSKEALGSRYAVRATKRVIRLVIWLFVLFVVIMAIIWVGPKIWHWALG